MKQIRLISIIMVFVLALSCLCGCVVDLPPEEPTECNHRFDTAEQLGDYFILTECSQPDCDVLGRLPSLRTYDDVFVCNYSDNVKGEIEHHYQVILDSLDKAEDYDEDLHAFVKDSDLYRENKEFEKSYDVFLSDLDYLAEQYQYAYVYYCTYNTADWETKYQSISAFHSDCISMYYKLFRIVYGTKYRNYFFSEEDGWDEESIKQILILSDKYGDEKYAKLLTRSDEIVVEFRAIEDASESSKVGTLLKELVDVNNQIASLAGYDNYVEYAYANEYDREYTPAEAETMRNYVKKYFGGDSMYKSYMLSYLMQMYVLKEDDVKSYFDALSTSDAKCSIFDSKIATDAVASYLKSMNLEVEDGEDIDMYPVVNDLFKNGNYFTGEHKSAFSYWIPAQNTSILYFGPDYYSSAFTFVHEFGHYYSHYYSDGLSTEMDLSETYSQGNEMLFLAYLEEYLKTQDITEPSSLFAVLECDKTTDCLQTILLSCAIDEFEQIIYTESYSGDRQEIRDILEDGIEATEYDALFEAISEDYGLNKLFNPIYWRYVCIESPVYYISYAMSMVPCLELFVMAKDNYDTARDSYCKLITFVNDESFVEIDPEGDKVCRAKYSEVLEYAGMTSSFDEETYKMISEYLGFSGDNENSTTN